MKDRTAYLIIGILSVVVPLLVAVLLFLPQFISLGNQDFTFLPHLNAILNSSTAVCLIIALLFIKNQRIKAHQLSMFAALILSTLFLLSYVVYHSQVESTPFGGQGTIRSIYFFILLTHILLSIAVIPFVLLAFYHALKANFETHKKIVKWGYPIWLYVAISGVTVYFMIRPYYV